MSRKWTISWRVGAIGAIGGVMLLLAAGKAKAQQPPLMPPPPDDLKLRIERLEQQNQALQDRLKGLTGESTPGTGPAPPGGGTGNPQDILKDPLTSAEQGKSFSGPTSAEKRLPDTDGYVIGSQLGMTARWRPDSGIWFETPNGDFTMHMGFWMQWDTVSFGESRTLKPANQIGDLQDGTYFRRIRPFWEGTAYDTIEWNLILALEQVSAIGGNANGLINLDEFWAGIYGIPFLGRVRFGHMKVPQGLEGNQMTSSRSMTFMENASYTDAFYRVFGTGIQFANTAFEKRMTWQGMLYRDDFARGNTGADFGDGQYSATGRVSGLLLDRSDDRELLHLAVSGTWRKAARTDANNLIGPNQVTLQARPELRDAFGGFGDNVSLPGNSVRLVSTGALNASSTTVLGTEAAYIRGPFSAQAEWAACFLSDAQVGTGARATRSFNGGYVLASYFLTGETRGYDKEFGTFARNYVTPFTNFWAKRGSMGLGAWEVAVRYSYLNLNDGPVAGGVMSGTTVGLNWYWNSNMKLQFEYLDDQRYHKGTAAGGTASGAVQGFGTRVQIQF